MAPDAVRGHLDGLILAVLTEGSLHGYAIIEELARRSGGELTLPTGTVYPALRRLEAADLVHGTWSEVGGRRRRTYTLTTNGRRTLDGKRDDWRRLSLVIGNVLGTPAGTGGPA